MNCESFQIARVRKVLVVGAGRGIGFALVRAILQENQNCQVLATYRSADGGERLQALGEPERLQGMVFHPATATAYEPLAATVRQHVDDLDLVINTVGSLHDGEYQPEKSLEQLSMAQLLATFQVNACVTPLLAKALLPCLRGERLSLFVSLSAKVGSLTDNRLGGWYSYRASKAALNMFVRNLAIEFHNRQIPAAALAIHPGTTATDMAAPFIRNTKLKVHSPEATAKHILGVLEGKGLAHSGQFWSWDQQQLPW